MTINNQASSQQRQLYAKPPVPAPRKIQAQKLAANKIDEFFARRIKKPSWRVSYDQHCCRRGRNCATSQELCADIEYKGIKKQSLTSITVNCTTKADAAKKGGDIIKKICMEINIVVAKPLVKWRHHRTGSKSFHSNRNSPIRNSSDPHRHACYANRLFILVSIESTPTASLNWQICKNLNM